jgi:hypothetical protein
MLQCSTTGISFAQCLWVDTPTQFAVLGKNRRLPKKKQNENRGFEFSAKQQAAERWAVLNQRKTNGRFTWIDSKYLFGASDPRVALPENDRFGVICFDPLKVSFLERV